MFRPPVLHRLPNHVQHSLKSARNLPKRGPDSSTPARWLSIDGRNRLSNTWIPSAKGRNINAQDEDTFALLIKTGFIQQRSSGLFHLLPFGLRVQNKIETLIDRHMRKLGASKLSLSSVTSDSLWGKSGRLEDYGPELLHLKGRSDDGLFLAPTHEEEISQLVRETVRTQKELPLRLYQISRKYRDEKRPRQGLLRAKEFLMKDLYTFDADEASALETYSKIKDAYANFFEDLGLPYIVAGADSGPMGGNLSHEFHVASSIGEDTIIECQSCDYIANEEVAVGGSPRRTKNDSVKIRNVKCSMGIAQDKSLVIVLSESSEESPLAEDLKDINVHAVKRALPELDTRVENPLEEWQKAVRSHASLREDFDSPGRAFLVCENAVAHVDGGENELPLCRWIEERQQQFERLGIPFPNITFRKKVTVEGSLAKVHEGGICPRCRSPSLTSKKAVELGHTFHLGTRYSQPLDLVLGETESSNKKLPVSMGCHGIGISRIIGTVTSLLSDEKGLNWPAAIAPYQTVIIASSGIEPGLTEKVYDKLTRNQLNAEGTKAHDRNIDAIIDDRSDSSLVQKLKDADLTGFPVIVVVGKQWSTNALIEVQCRRLRKDVGVPLSNLRNSVKDFLTRL